MKAVREFHPPVAWLVLAAGAVAVLAAGAALAPSIVPIGSAVLLAAAAATAGLLTWLRAGWWRSWLVVVAVSAIGPFLDIVTHYPINWLIGLVVLFMASALLLRAILRWRPQALAAPAPLRLPVLGICLGIYVAYFFIQALRPDVNRASALLEMRAPLIGLAAYGITVYWLWPSIKQQQGLRLLRQFLVLFVAVSLVVAAYGLFQAAVGFNRLQAWGLTEAGGVYFQNQTNFNGGTVIFRIFSTMRRNEVLGVFLYLSIIMGVAALQLRVGSRWLVLTSLGLSTLALLLALSLTSVVMLGAWIASLFLFSKLSKRWLVRLTTLGVFALGVTLIVNQVLGGLIAVRFQEHVVDTQQGIGRVQMAQNWMAEMYDRPLLQGMFGSGLCLGLDDATLGRLQSVLNTLGVNVGASTPCGWQREIHDNWYATHSLEIGWLGLLPIWLLFGLLAVDTLPRLRRRWREPERSALTMLALGALMFWPAGFVGDLIVYMPINVYFWSLIGFLEVSAMASAD